jgi:YfiH family protein
LVLTREDGFYRLGLFEKNGARALFTTQKYDMGFPRQAPRPKASRGRLEAYKKIGLQGRCVVCPSQVHGRRVFVAQDRHRGCGALARSDVVRATDAVITATPRLPIGILTADCLPVFMYDPGRRVIALAHAGWRGVHRRIISRTLEKMRRVFGVAPQHLLVALGPAIRPCCYEVGRDFLRFFPASVKQEGRKFYFDIAAEAFRELVLAGVAPQRIHDTRICTSCMEHEFFSFRRQGEAAGRSMSVMEIL